MTLTEDEEPFYPGSSSLKRSAGGTGPAIPDTEPQPWEEMTVEVNVGGKIVKFYPISALAVALGRNTMTIRHWDQVGIIPPSPWRTTSHSPHAQRRLYTHAHVAGLQQIAEDEKLMSEKRVYVHKTNFIERAKQLFAELEPS